jgi:uncharacterized membrane protein YeaQ/YmgE (transglycosylase-associated protein family)
LVRTFASEQAEEAGEHPYRGAGAGQRPAAPAAQGEKAMSVEAIVIALIIGAAAGWLAGQVVRGIGFGLIGNIIVGIVGGFLATWLLPRIGIAIGGGIIAAIINATIGAVILLLIIGLVKRA